MDIERVSRDHRLFCFKCPVHDRPVHSISVNLGHGPGGIGWRSSPLCCGLSWILIEQRPPNPLLEYSLPSSPFPPIRSSLWLRGGLSRPSSLGRTNNRIDHS